MRKVICLAVALCCMSTHGARAQSEYRAFSFYMENDALSNSDTGYTNGIRLSWMMLRYRPALRAFPEYGIPTLLRMIGFRRMGLIPNKLESQECQTSGDRCDRVTGACFMFNVGIAQTMYTPDSLADTQLQRRDQPYAGFLFVNVGATTIDDPSQRHNCCVVFTQFSNQLILGVTGQAAHAEDTQSLAHWTWSTASHRPLGWRNQLRQAPQIGLLTDLQFRTKYLEWCTRGCDGTVDEGRWLDFTPHTELVAGTWMVRGSLGATARFGAHFPSVVGAMRIPVSVPPVPAKKHCFWGIVCERYWWDVFGTADFRAVPYNMFLDGGLADGGPSGWRALRQIDTRRRVDEFAVGAQFGNSRMSLSAQQVGRTAEFDVRGNWGPKKRYHPYASFNLTMHPALR